MTEIQEINSAQGEHFTAAELAALFARPGVVDYTVITTGFATARIRRVRLTIDRDLFMLGPTAKDSSRTEVNGFSKE